MVPHHGPAMHRSAHVIIALRKNGIVVPAGSQIASSQHTYKKQASAALERQQEGPKQGHA